MSIAIRIFQNETVLSYEIGDESAVSIGSGKTDSIHLSGKGITPEWLKVTFGENGWQIATKAVMIQDGQRQPSPASITPGSYYTFQGADNTGILFFHSPKGEQHSAELTDSPFSIGRKAGNSLVIRSQRVSGTHAVITRSGSQYTLMDNNSRNGTYVNGKRIREIVLKLGDQIVIDTADFMFTGEALAFVADDRIIREQTLNNKSASMRPADPHAYPYFKRSPRLRTDLPSGEISILPPPSAAAKPDINWLSVLATPVGMIIVLAVMYLVVPGNSKFMLLFTVPMSVIGVLVAVINYRSQVRKFRETTKLRERRYQTYLQETVDEIANKQCQQLTSMKDAHPSSRNCVAIAQNMERRLWERAPRDDDFMTLRIGTGTVDFCIPIRTQAKNVTLEDDALEDQAAEIARRYSKIANAPIVIDFKQHPCCGVVGDRDVAIALAQNVIMQAATAHSYEDVKIIVLYPKYENDQDQWKTVRWLPHTFSKDRDIRYVCSSVFDADQPLNALEDIIKQRINTLSKDNRKTDELLPYLFFVIADQSLVQDRQLLRYLSMKDPRLQVGALLLDNAIQQLPKECTDIIFVKRDSTASYRLSNTNDKIDFMIDRARRGEFYSFCRCLASIRSISFDAETALPNCITFLEGYNVKRPEEIDFTQWWKAARPDRTMSVPIGVRADGRPFYFDISEFRHGPHGLVGGKTRWGKSYMMQAWILSMALHFSPQDVSFVLIDFKGTGLLRPLEKLPHLAGTISNLDTKIARNLIALESELSRREALFDQAGVGKIGDYLKLYRSGKVKEPLPYLFVVIDEFAEFKAQFPEFQTVLKRMFATGGSLGVQMILMAQQPDGVVDDAMDANTHFRWCLKVADARFSKGFIKHADAVFIQVRGRAFIQVGNDEIYELIQSYYCGATFDPERTEKTVFLPMISEVSLNGRRQELLMRKDVQENNSNYEEIDAIVEYLDAFVKKNHVPASRKIWTNRLAGIIPLHAVMQPAFDGHGWHERSDGDLCASVGAVDNPRQQCQEPLVLNFSKDGHVAVFGAPGTGKTTFLQTTILSLALSYSPAEINIYAMDFGGWSMGVFNELPHMGGIANGNDEERVNKLARLITKILQERKQLFSDACVGNKQDYESATGKRIPYAVLVLDNFAPVLKLYPDLEDFFITLTMEGGNYGVYLVASVNSQLSLGFRIGQNIKNNIALQMTDKGDYLSLVGRTEGLEPENFPGRGLIKATPPMEFQTALPTEGATDGERSMEIRRIGSEMNACWKGGGVQKLRIMPESIPYGSVPSQTLALGLDVEDIEPVSVSFDKSHCLLLSGRAGSGKSNLATLLTKQFCEKHSSCTVMIRDSLSGGMHDMASRAQPYCASGAAFDQAIASLQPVLKQRREQLQQSGSSSFPPILIVIDDLNNCFHEATNETIDRLTAIARIGRGLNVNLLATGTCDELRKMYNQGERLTMSLCQADVCVLLGGCYQDHDFIKCDIPYRDAGKKLGEHEGYLIDHEKAIRFKAMYHE